MEQEFLSKVDQFLKLDAGLVDIQVMGSFGNRWGKSKGELIVRLLYKGEKRIITTLHEDTYEEEIRELILKTRSYFRSEKLERILDGDL